MPNDNSQSVDAAGIAQRFVSARLAGQSLPAYPGVIPASAAQAYACQDAAIRLWPEPIVGWKVGLVAPAARAEFGAERLVGPIFQSLLRPAGAGVMSCPVFAGGFAAVEAEFVFRLARDVPPNQLEWTEAEAASYVGTLHVGVEIASSPLAAINDLGPVVTASDFGNNFGLLVGNAIADWQACDWSTLRCATFIDGQQVGSGSAVSVPGGPLAALRFALSLCAQRGHPLRTGQYVCTGATTGVHDIRIGQQARVDFHNIDSIGCRIVPAAAYVTGAQR